MTDSEQPGGSQFKFGNIEHSTGFAIGDRAHVTVNQQLAARQDEVRALLDDFLLLMESDGGAIDDAQGIRESAEMARDEVTCPSPKWQAVRRMLTTIAADVAGVASLTDAIANIQLIVGGLKLPGRESLAHCVTHVGRAGRMVPVPLETAAHNPVGDLRWSGSHPGHSHPRRQATS